MRLACIAALVVLVLALQQCQCFELWLLKGAVSLHSAVEFNSTKLGACVSIKNCFNDRAHLAFWTELTDDKQIVFYDSDSCTGKSVASPTKSEGVINFFDEDIEMAGEVSSFKTWKEGLFASSTYIAQIKTTPETTMQQLLFIKPEQLIPSSKCT